MLIAVPQGVQRSNNRSTPFFLHGRVRAPPTHPPTHPTTPFSLRGPLMYSIPRWVPGKKLRPCAAVGD